MLSSCGRRTGPRMQLRRLWPHAPLALLVLASGALNLIAGLGQLPHDLQVFNAAAQIDGTLGIFGHSTQALLGGALMLCGVGLFWRMRTPWAFALLFSILTIAAEALRHQWNATLIVPVIMLLGLVVFRNRFHRRAVAANIFVSLLSIATVVGYGTVGTFLLGSGFRPRITDFFTAFYFTIVTFSTVGYGDIVPITTQTRLFAISLVVFGLSVFATAVATTFGPAITTEVGRIFAGKRRSMEVSDHVIVVGDGDIAEHVAIELEASGDTVVRVDESRALESKTLADAHVGRSRMVVATCSDDSKNAVIALIAKDANPKVRVVAVAGSADGIRRLKLAHADAVFAPSVLGARLLAQIANGHAIPAEFQDLLSTTPAEETVT